MNSSVVSPEAATPLISNTRINLSASQSQTHTSLPPSLELPASAVSFTTYQWSSARVARFSSPETAPIIMTSFEGAARETQLSRNRDRQARASFLELKQAEAARLRKHGSRMITGLSCCPSTHKYEMQSLALCLAWDAGCVSFAYSQKMWRRLKLILIELCSSYLHQLYFEAQERRRRHRSLLRYGHPFLKTSMSGCYRNRRRAYATAIQGLPNFGQTCFLNAVLQCLAALDSFVEYVIHVATIQDESTPKYDEVETGDIESEIDDDEDFRQRRWTREGHNHERYSQYSTKVDAGLLPYLLVGVLLSINGIEPESDSNQKRNFAKRRPLDPRLILEAVSYEHEQFRSRNRFQVLASNSATSEQQDAQELLQAMLGMLLAAANPDTVDDVFPHFLDCDHQIWSSNENRKTLYGDGHDDILTTASGAKEAKIQVLVGATVATIANGEHDLLLIPTQKETGGSHVFHPKDRRIHDRSDASLGHCSYIREEDSSSESDSEDNDTETNADEKKQDEFQFHVPYVSSEEDLLQLETQRKMVKMPARSSDTASPLSMDSLDRLSGLRSDIIRIAPDSSKQISTTLLKPSPFCGWLGSSLQCTRCRHVRPIQNAQFLDIPVIPTSVSKYLSGSVSRRNKHVDQEPVKHSPANKGPPCTLEELLQEFTEVERVSGVECRNCTLKRELDDLEEEVFHLREGIRSVIAKARRKAKRAVESTNCDEELAKDLRNDLDFAESKLNALKSVSPDEEGSLEGIVFQENIGEMMPRLSIEKSDAFKRLFFTRLPLVLAIHIQRRFYDPISNHMSKTAQHVVFPEYLDMAPFCVYGGAMRDDYDAKWAGTASLNASAEKSHSKIIYRLQALIEHHGGAFCGHYVAYRRDSAAGSWLYISDDTLRRVSWDFVRERQAYMLFYEAIPVNTRPS